MKCSGCVVSAVDETSDPLDVDKNIPLDAVDEIDDSVIVDENIPSDLLN